MFLQSSVSSVSFFFSRSAIGFHADSKVQDYFLHWKICHLYDLVCNYWVSTKELGMIYIPLFPFISLQIGERFRAPESSKSHPNHRVVMVVRNLAAPSNPLRAASVVEKKDAIGKLSQETPSKWPVGLSSWRWGGWFREMEDSLVRTRMSMELSNYLVSWVATYLGDLQPTYIGFIIYLLSSMDIPVSKWSYEATTQKRCFVPSLYIIIGTFTMIIGKISFRGWEHRIPAVEVFPRGVGTMGIENDICLFHLFCIKLPGFIGSCLKPSTVSRVLVMSIPGDTPVIYWCTL